jgi:hypothetical protein
MTTPGTPPSPRRLTLRIYTFAHRLPQTIGKLPGGVTLPWVVGLQQFVVFFAGVWVLFSSRRVWAHLGLVPDALIMLGLPALLAWLARAAKLQGRGLIRGLFGLVALGMAAASRHAAAAARGTRRTGTLTTLQGRLLTEPGPPAWPTQPLGMPAVTPGTAEPAVPPRPGAEPAPAVPAPPPTTRPIQTDVSAPAASRAVPAMTAMPAGRRPGHGGASRPGGRYALIDLVDAARLLRAGGGGLISAHAPDAAIGEVLGDPVTQGIADAEELAAVGAGASAGGAR